jgi:hypothetical protein
VPVQRNAEKRAVDFNHSAMIAPARCAPSEQQIDGWRMSQIPEATDLEAQIAELIKRAGDSLRQSGVDAPRDAAGGSGADRPCNDAGAVATRLEGAQ